MMIRRLLSWFEMPDLDRGPLTPRQWAAEGLPFVLLGLIVSTIAYVLGY